MAHIPRLYLNTKIKEHEELPLDVSDVHYLRTVLRLEVGATIKVFNGDDGEWDTTLQTLTKKSASVVPQKCLRQSEPKSGLHIFCAPIKKDRWSTAIEKASELGVETFTPLLTEFTDIPKVNQDKMIKQSIEATRQSEGLHVMDINKPISVSDIKPLIDKLDCTFIAAERQTAIPMKTALDQLSRPQSCAIIIGPEGGFSESDWASLMQIENIQPVHLGARILRTETAVISAATLWQSKHGAWAIYERKSS